MSTNVSRADKSARGRRRYRVMFYVILPLVIVGAVIFSLWQTVRDNPNQERSVTLGSAGRVLVSLRTTPHPAMTTGAILVEVKLRDLRTNPVSVDRVQLTNGASAEQSQEVVAQPTEVLGTYLVDVRFASIGDWWMDVILEYNGVTATTRFVVPVKPAL